MIGKRPEQLENIHGRIRNRAYGEILKALRNHAGKRPPVLNHVGDAGGVAEVMLLHDKFSAWNTAKTQSAEMQVSGGRTIGAQILRDLGVRKMRLLTNNRKHLVGLRGYGLEVTSLEAIPRDTPLREVAKPKKTKAKSA